MNNKLIDIILILLPILSICAFVHLLFSGWFTSKSLPRKIKKMVLEESEMNQHQKTDFVVNVMNAPLITLTESKIPNEWWHPEIDNLFHLTANGFYLSERKKTELVKYNLLYK